MGPLDDAAYASIDAALASWRQGDCVLGEHWFVFRTDLARPITQAGAHAAAERIDTAESEILGFMVLTQTCDLVRKARERPFIEACPIVEVEEALLREVERGRRPGYVFIPALENRHLVGDLDRVMTLEKSVVAMWERIEGWQTDTESRRISLALARKRARVAFPDDFVEFATPLMSRMSSKHDKQSDEGRALRALREIRVRAEPSWDADAIKLIFWFIRDPDDSTFEGKRWDILLEEWEKRILAKGRFVDVQALVQTLEDLSAREYVESDPLDLDYLSSREGE